MLVLGPSSEAEMIACFLGTELTSTRFGDAIRSALAANGQPESLLTHPDLSDTNENAARRAGHGPLGTLIKVGTGVGAAGVLPPAAPTRRPGVLSAGFFRSRRIRQPVGDVREHVTGDRDRWVVEEGVLGHAETAHDGH
jgi:hypothetical protein